MQTMERRIAAQTHVSRLNPSYYISAVVLAGTLAVLLNNSTRLAFFWTGGVLAAWVLFETLAVTVFLHRFMTHGAVGHMRPWYARFWLWWSRSGMVKFWEWVINHAAHHILADTPWDSYTPNADMEFLKGKKKYKRLGRVLPLFWRNGVIYGLASDYYRENPRELQKLRDENVSVDRALTRNEEFEWANGAYGNINRGILINLGLFYTATLPLALRLSGVLSVLVFVLLPLLMWGIKAVMYLIGGHVINKEGHGAKEPTEDGTFQSNIPWYWMLFTFFMMGEGWHKFHHDAAYAARFHRFLDPGWWVIWLSAKLKLVGDITVAVKVAPRLYYKRKLNIGWSAQNPSNLGAAA